MITQQIVDLIRPGDVLKITDSRWMEGTAIVSTVHESDTGALVLGGEGADGPTPWLFRRVLIRRPDGQPSQHAATRTVELVKIADVDPGPLTRPEKPEEASQRRKEYSALVELACWLGAEHAKMEVGLPSEWQQGTWQGRMTDGSGNLVTEERDGQNWCKTTACAAGHVAIRHGGLFAIYDDDSPEGYRGVSLLTEGDALMNWNPDMVVTPDGSAMWVPAYARQVLGLDGQQSGRLFSGKNSYDTMMELLREFIADKKEPSAIVGPDRETRLRAAIAAADPD